MVSLAARQWMAEGRVEGRVEGIAAGRVEGIAAGRVEGEKKALQRVLERRFGPLPQDYQARLSQASVSDLDTWLDRALDANDLKAVFG